VLLHLFESKNGYKLWVDVSCVFVFTGFAERYQFSASDEVERKKAFYRQPSIGRTQHDQGIQARPIPLYVQGQITHPGT